MIHEKQETYYLRWVLECLEGWEEEYEQIRFDDSLQ